MKIWLLWVVLTDGGTAQVPMPPIQCMAGRPAVRPVSEKKPAKD